MINNGDLQLVVQSLKPRYIEPQSENTKRKRGRKKQVKILEGCIEREEQNGSN